MKHPVLLLLLALTTFSSSAQKGNDLQKKLDIFWKSKHLRAQATAHMATLHPGDTIADIGTGDGWFAAVLSMYGDNLTFFLEDVDSTVWDKATFDSAFQHFSRIQRKKASHQFHYFKGTETSTGLPRGKFHKVLIMDTYHHFNNRKEMLSDAVELLKPLGKIVMLEALARRPGDIHHGCRKKIFSEQEIISDLESHGMAVESVTFIHKIAGRKNKLFVFVKK